LSRGGNTTKIHAVRDALGNPIRFILTPGNEADCTQALFLLEGLKAESVLADKGYDSEAIVNFIMESGATVVIPPKNNRLNPRECDFMLYKERNLIERFFNTLKHFRAIATRYAKKATNFLGLINIAATVIWLK